MLWQLMNYSSMKMAHIVNDLWQQQIEDEIPFMILAVDQLCDTVNVGVEEIGQFRIQLQ